MKKLFLLIIFFLFIPFFVGANDCLDEKEEITIYFFDDRLCPVCSEAKIFIEGMAEENEKIDLIIYPISDTGKLKEVSEKYEIEGYRVMAPTIIIVNNLDYTKINFFQFRDFTSRQKEMIEGAIEGEIVEDDCCVIRIPFLNIEIDIGNWSLPFIAAALGSIDGFNVCSIGALILILSIVMIFESKRKIFFFGGLFIITTVIIYGSLVFIWGRIFESLIGHLEILRILVGLAALTGGVYFFKEFWRFFRYGPTCQSSQSVLAQKATKKLKKSFEQPGRGTLLLAGAVISFAAIITIVELPCSVGVPIAFSGILIEAGVSLAEHIGYILIFLFFYMLIEIVIFTGAVLTKKIWFAGSKTITWITFIGSITLFYLAFYYLFS